MNVTILIDDPIWFDQCFKSLVQDLQQLDSWLDMDTYKAKYANIDIAIYVTRSCKESVILKIESLLQYRDIDFLFNLGYCYIWRDEHPKVEEDNLVLVSSTQCDDNYVDLMSIKDSSHKKVIELDKRFEKRILAAAKALSNNFKSISCYSSSDISQEPICNGSKRTCHVFDQKSFALYDMAQRYNRIAICLYQVRSSATIDLHDYLINKDNTSTTMLSKVLLDFIVKLYS